MPDRKLALEALSAILGRPVKFHKHSSAGAQQNLLRPHDIFHIKCNDASLKNVPSNKNSKLPLRLVRETCTEAEVIRKELLVDEEDFFDPEYDFDFTHIKDTATHERGGEQYSRPCGWMRIALKVVGKYEDGDSWLGRGASAWPVSYHGTSFEGAEGIIQGRYKAGPRKVYGRGIYSTPNVGVASKYSTRFESKRTKKTYDVILQNRINPEKREKKPQDYWLVPIPDDKKDEEAKIAENSIRPYGLLLKEVEKHS